MNGKGNKTLVFWFLLPAIVVLALFKWIPLVSTFILSLTDWDILTPAKFVGFDNYIRLLGFHKEGARIVANDPNFWHYLFNTFYILVSVGLIGFSYSLAISSLLRRIKGGRVFFRSVYLLPLAALGTSAFIIWRWLFNPDFGMINSFLGFLGIKGPDWLSSTRWAKPAIMFMNLWFLLPIGLAVLLPVLNVKRKGIYKLSFLLFMIVLISGSFGAAYIMTGGGPAGATTTLTYYLYNTAYQWFRLGYSSAIGIFLAIILFLLGVAFIRTIERNSIRISSNSEGNSEPSLNQNGGKNEFFLILAFVVLIIVAILQFSPFLWAFLTSLKDPGDVFASPPKLFSQRLVWENYVKVWKAVPMGRFYLNTLAQTIPSVLLQLVVGLFAGYALSISRPKGYRLTELFLLFPILLHTSVIRLPIFILIKKANLTDTYFALCLPTYVWWGAGILLFKMFFDGLAHEPIEKARKKGLSEWKIFKEVVLPQTKPAFILVGLFSFLSVWNAFYWPLIMINSMEKKTLPIGMATLQGLHSTDWTFLMAGAMISIIPLLIIFFFVQRYLFRRLSVKMG